MSHKKNSLICVGGYGGELLRLPFVAGYFSDLERKMKVSKPNMHTCFIQNPFYHRIRNGVETVSSEILQQSVFFDSSTVVVAHSRGALETWIAILKYPYLLKSENLLSVQLMSMPMGGSPLASLFAGLLKSFLPKPLLKPLLELGLSSRRKNYLNDIYENLSPSDKSLINEKVRFHSASCEKAQLPWFLKPFNKWFTENYGENDGLIQRSSQECIPFPVKRWDTHHGSLLCNSLVSTHTFEQDTCFTELTYNLFDLRLSTPASIKRSKELKVSTYNTGMLDIPVWGVPHCKERLGHLPAALESFDSDLICIQESFEEVEFHNREYRALTDGPTDQHGLVTLLSKSFLDKFSLQSVKYRAFDTQRIFEPIANFQKGVLVTDLKGESDLRIINLHFTAFSTAKSIRKKQIKELALLVLDSVRSSQVLVCGDFNMTLSKKQATGTFKSTGERIDHIFAFCKELGSLKPIREKICLTEAFVPTKEAMVELSDHYLLQSEFRGVF